MKEWFKSNPELFHRRPYDRPGCDTYGLREPQLLEKLFAVRRRLVEADLGEGIATPHWGA